MFSFGFASGLPYMIIISTSTAWLRDVEVDLAYIGFFSWVTFMYAFKFLWAPLVDRFSIPVLKKYGHRKSWIVLMQLVIFINLLVLSGIDPKNIGVTHIRNKENAWKKDKTGRSLLGQRYVWALKNWLGYNTKVKDPDHYDEKLGQKITKWLGEKNPDKERLVCLLIARLIWDWKSYEELQHGGENKELELQVCRMDICHYNFPENLNRFVSL